MLGVLIVCVHVVWELEERLEDDTESALIDKMFVVLFEQGVSEFEVDSGCFHNIRSKSIGLLGDFIFIIVVSREWIKRSELEPSGAKLLSCVQSVPTDISSNHLNTPYLEHEVLVDRISQELPTCNIISCPMEPVFVRTKCAASCQNKRSEPYSLEELMGGISLHHTIESMYIGFRYVTIVCVVHGNSIGLDSVCSWAVWNIMSVIKYLWSFWHNTRAITEIRDLVHI